MCGECPVGNRGLHRVRGDRPHADRLPRSNPPSQWAVFLRDVFDSDQLAEAINHLLVVGFLLLNLGYAIVLYRVTSDYDTEIAFINDLVQRLGILVLSLGVVHLLNMLVFWKIRNHGNDVSPPPPVKSAHMPNPIPGAMAPPPPINF